MASRRLLLIASLATTYAAAGPFAKPAPPPVIEPEPVVEEKSKPKIPLVLGGFGGVVAAAAAVPAVRRSVLSLFGAGDVMSKPPERVKSPSSGSASAAAAPKAPKKGEPATEALRQTSDEPDAQPEKFTLTPERLATISDLNPNLEGIIEMLASVPVFSAAVGNGTSPLTVPTEDGRKLAYFFTEHADAEAFLRAVKANAGADLNAQVIGVSLADIIKAYSSSDAKAARETFVLIPTMAEVAAARQLMRAAGKEQTELGPGSGLVPVFWSEALAVQSAGGKQRKVLFFRVGDLQHMWKNLSEARKQAGDLNEEGAEQNMPEGPTVQVSDLQTMAGLLVDANKTDDVMFLPSSAALRKAQQQGDTARAAASGGGAPPGVMPEGNGGAAEAAGAEAEEDDVMEVGGEEEEEEMVV